MIRYCKRADIDHQRWDQCILKATNSRICALSWYLDLACSRQWDALIRDDYTAVFPLPYGRKGCISYVYTPFFIQQLGVFSPDPVSTAEIDDFLGAIPPAFRLVELNINLMPQQQRSEFRYVRRMNFELELNAGYEDLCRHYAENTRRNLRKSSDACLIVQAVDDAAPLIDLFRRERGKTITHWKDTEYHRLNNILEQCRQRENRIILEARSTSGEYLAGAIFLTTDHRSIFLFSATNQAGRDTAAMTAIIDAYIRSQAGTNHVLDFEGSDDPGLARFYRSFGASEHPYCLAVRNELPWLVRRIKSILK